MKRAAKSKKTKIVARTFPLLCWRRCCVCGQEFLWERGWRWRFSLSLGTPAASTENHYVCGTCAPTEAAVEHIILNPPQALDAELERKTTEWETARYGKGIVSPGYAKE